MRQVIRTQNMSSTFVNLLFPLCQDWEQATLALARTITESLRPNPDMKCYWTDEQQREFREQQASNFLDETFKVKHEPVDSVS